MKNTIKDELTKREREVGWLVHKGFQNPEIAERLGITNNTVKDHNKNIFKKLDVSTRAELAGLSMWDDSIENILDSPMQSPSSAIFTLDGMWLSKFKFDMHRRGKIISEEQIDLELIEPQSKKSTYIGKNIRCTSSAKTEYLHRLQCEVFENHVLGKWFNKCTKYCGCYQLYIHNNGNMMFGMYLGNASNNQIVSGEWIWIRIGTQDDDSKLEQFLKGKDLRTFKELKEIFDSFIDEGRAIDLNDLIE